MKKLLLVAAISLTAFSAQAEHVNGYVRSNGTYVQPYERSAPNNTVQDNYSYQGNTNPYTGTVGTNNYQHDTTSPYYTGPNAYGQVGHEGQE